MDLGELIGAALNSLSNAPTGKEKKPTWAALGCFGVFVAICALVIIFR